MKYNKHSDSPAQTTRAVVIKEMSQPRLAKSVRDKAGTANQQIRRKRKRRPAVLREPRLPG